MSYGNGNSWDVQMLLDVLAQGEEQTNQLERMLEVSPSVQRCKDLVQQIQSNFRNAITIAKIIETTAPVRLECQTVKNVLESTMPNIGSSHTENSARASKTSERGEMLNKRNKQPKWANRVFAAPGREVEALEDGNSWRKYGQKDILGASHPRAYYRCSYRNSLGCLATKQVQRSDENPYAFDVIYRGEHTCMQKTHRNSSPASHQSGALQQDQQLIPGSQAGIDFELEEMGMQDHGLGSFAFSFPSTPVTKFMPESCVSSPRFVSPVSESDYFSVSLWNDSSETELGRIVSAATSGMNCSVVGSFMHRYN